MKPIEGIPQSQKKFLVLMALMILAPIIGGCERPDPEAIEDTIRPTLIILSPQTPPSPTETKPAVIRPTATIKPLITPQPAYPGTPTPDPTRPQPADEIGQFMLHVVAVGETLSQIARLYATDVGVLTSINSIDDNDFLSVGQELLVPQTADFVGPSFKIVPNSELVYGPSAMEFDMNVATSFFGGYLLDYREEVEGLELSGPEIVQLIANRFSINPRLLMALVEYRSGWVTQQGAEDDGYPMGYDRQEYEGLYQQLSWAANMTNLGYYGRSEGGLRSFDLVEDVTIDFSGEINDGTAGLQLLFGSYPQTSYEGWLVDVGPDGFFATYNQLFGNPFTYTVDPLWPSDLSQPSYRLPWEPGKTWYFTSGPHGGWASGSAWAALDFAPQHEQLGCYVSDEWVVAMTDGVVVRSELGSVVIDLDDDDFPGTGWAITYMHLESRDRIPEGVAVRKGDRLGHPSCEGGFSNGTHVHVARTYNGRWISADGDLPFIMDGWISQGLGREYDGLLIRDDVVKEACSCREEGNAITAD